MATADRQVIQKAIHPQAHIPIPKGLAISKQVQTCIPALLQKKLAPIETLFVEQFVTTGGDVELAALRCQVEFKEAERWLNRLYVIDAIQCVTMALFATDAVKARRVLIEIMEDYATPPATRRQAAMDVLHMAKLDPGKLLTVRAEMSAPAGARRFENLSEAERDILEKLLEKAAQDPGIIDVEVG